MRDYFDQLAAAVCQAGDGQRVSLCLNAEASDFIRFNHAKVRQATHVEQRYGTVTVTAGLRQAASTLSLSGTLAADISLLQAERDALAAQLPLVPEDEHLLLPDAVVNTGRQERGSLPTARQVIDAVATHAAGLDLVGIYAGGPAIQAFADSRGQRNWHSVESFHFEWCLYREADQAVKTTYAGTHWRDADFTARLGAAKARLPLLALPRKTLQPGAYRTWFSPVAVADLLGTLSWGGFGCKPMKTGTSSLIKLHREETRLHPSIVLTEDTAHGIAPRFQPDGFTKPDSVALVQTGRTAGVLVSARSAREYALPFNGSNADESPEALAMAGGTLADAEVLKALGTGVYVSDLHYLNYSDRQACRMTGMTRFACLWVEDGVPVAPLAVMRFDDSLLRMFGDGLVALGSQVDLVPESGTYGSRHLRSISAPGALVEGFRLTL